MARTACLSGRERVLYEGEPLVESIALQPLEFPRPVDEEVLELPIARISVSEPRSVKDGKAIPSLAPITLEVDPIAS